MVKRSEILDEVTVRKRLVEDSADRVDLFVHALCSDDEKDKPQFLPIWYLWAMGAILQIKEWEESFVFQDLVNGLPSSEALVKYFDSLLMPGDHSKEACKAAILVNEAVSLKYLGSVVRTEAKSGDFEFVIPLEMEDSIPEMFAALLLECQEDFSTDDFYMEEIK